MKITDNLSKILRTETLSVSEWHQKHNLLPCRKYFEKDEGDNEEPSLPRKKKASRQFEVGEEEATIVQQLKITFANSILSIKHAIFSIQEYFDWAGYVAYQPKAENRNASSNYIQTISNFYGDNLNKSELSTQLQVISSSLPKDVQIKVVILHYVLFFQQSLSTSMFEG